MIRTRFTELLGIEAPVVSAPMARMSGGRLAAAVSAAGGLGTFGAALVAARIDADYVRAQVADIRQRTDRPFGIGFLSKELPASEDTFVAALAEAPAAVLFSFGDVGPWLPRARAAGAVTICQVQSFGQAADAVRAGADVLAVQGNEAGGHTGTANLLPLLVQVVEAFPDVPVLAAGGITDGRSLAAVLAAGADGAWAGTLFTTVTEADELSPAHRAAVLASDGRDTLRSSVYDVMNAHVFGDLPWPEGIAYRTWRSPFVETWHGREVELAEHAAELAAGYVEAFRNRDPAVMPMGFGEGAGSITGVRSAAEAIAAVCADAERSLQAAAARVQPSS